MTDSPIHSTSGADALTAFSILFGARLRQFLIWAPIAAITFAYWISTSIHNPTNEGSPGETRDVVSGIIMLGGLVAASGTRNTTGQDWDRNLSCSSSSSLQICFFYSMTNLGVAAADALPGIVGATLLLLATPESSRSLASGLLFLTAAIPLFLAQSLQFGLAFRLVGRPLALVLTALISIATLVRGVGESTLGLGPVGGLLFPVSSVMRAVEEPLGLELAARAILPGVLYDLALFAALLALRPSRARGSHADRDRQ